MKKIVIALSVIIFLTVTATSCSSTSKCAAYNNIQKYQKEVKY